jgi:hypothetical protein
MGGPGSGGHNKLSLEALTLRGTFRKHRHAESKESNPTAEKSNPTAESKPPAAVADLSDEDKWALAAYFRTGTWPVPAWLQYRVTDAQLADWWRQVADKIVVSHVEAFPGTRPFGWWQWDAPERRRRLGGIGDAAHDVLAVARAYAFGVPAAFLSSRLAAQMSERFRGVPLDPADPPRYEAQATFLDRHGLFVEGERDRVPAAAWRPEIAAVALEDVDPTTRYALRVMETPA